MKKEYMSNLNFPKTTPFCTINYGSINLDNIVTSKFSNNAAVIAIHKGNVILEKYFNNHSVNDTFHVASTTKSIISALIGIAIDKGFIKSVDEKILSFFPEYNNSYSNDLLNTITIKNLLTMTVPYDFPDWQEPFDKLCESPDWIQYTLGNISSNSHLGDFKYSSEGAHLLSCILTKATHKSAREFANEYLFEPLGIKTFPDYKTDVYDFDYLFGKNLKGWPHDPQGNSTGGWGLNLTLRDMALFGYLFMNNGFYNGKQIVPESWVKQSITPFSDKKVFAENKYGYLWWINHYGELNCYSAVGDGGNIISCIPEKELVVAVAAEMPKPIENPYEFIENYIIPYI